MAPKPKIAIALDDETVERIDRGIAAIERLAEAIEKQNRLQESALGF